MLPYDVHYQHPLAFGRPRIYGSPVRTELLVARATAAKRVTTAPRLIEFCRRGIVTALSHITTYTYHVPSWNAFALQLDVLKDGRAHLCTDGERIQTLSPDDLNQWSTPWVPVWIPVGDREKWQCEWTNGSDVDIPVEFAARVEYFEEEPVFPKNHRRTETRFYKATQKTPANTVGTAEQLDFERDGVVTAWHVICGSPDPDVIVNMGFDVLMDGKRHMTSNGRNASPIGPLTVAGNYYSSGAWFPCYEPVTQRGIWEVFPTNRNLATEVEWDFIAQVEEYLD